MTRDHDKVWWPTELWTQEKDLRTSGGTGCGAVRFPEVGNTGEHRTWQPGAKGPSEEAGAGR